MSDNPLDRAVILRHPSWVTKKTNLLLWTLGLACCAIVVAELWARARFADELPPHRPTVLELPSELVQSDPLLGRHFVPNASKFFESAHNEFKVNYQINEIGLRDSGMISSGTKQPIVLVLGDSSVEGWGVMPEATFALEMQRQLRFQKGAEIFPRILNAGMTGFGATQSYLLGKKLIDEINPKVIIFAYSSLMPVQDFRFLKHAKISSSGLVESAGTSPSAELDNNLVEQGWLNRLMLYRLLKERIDARHARENVAPGNPDNDIFAATRGTNDNIANLHGVSLAHVSALATLAKKRGINFMLLHVPLPHQVAQDEWLDGRIGHGFEPRIYDTPDVQLLNEFCRTENIECALPLDMFRQLAKERSSRIFFKYDYALTEVGHNALIDFLIGKVRSSLNIEAPTK